MSGHKGTGAAPGKVILFGEHAVVHGQPKVALAGVRRTQTPTSVNVPLDPLPQELAGGRGVAAKAAKMSAGGSEARPVLPRRPARSG